MSQEKKPKHKIITMKQIARSKEIIRKVDNNTFFYKTDRLYDNGDPIGEYMVYHHKEKGWLCDCRDYYYKTQCKNKDNGKCKIHTNHDSCNHIEAAKEL